MSMEDNASAGLLEAKEFEHILKSNGEPLKSTELDEVLKLVSLKNNRDIDYEGMATFSFIFFTILIKFSSKSKKKFDF